MRDLIRNRCDQAESVVGLGQLLFAAVAADRDGDVLNCITLIRRNLDELQATQLEINRRNNETRNLRRVVL